MSNAERFTETTYAQTIQHSKNTYGGGTSTYKDTQLIDCQLFERLQTKEKQRIDLPIIGTEWKKQYSYIHIVPFVNGKMVESSIVVKKL